MPMFIVLISWQGHCESSLGPFNECRLRAKRPPTLRPSQPTWTVSPPVGCHHSTPTVAIYYYYSAQRLILILLSHSG